jgi:hypothetical protein
VKGLAEAIVGIRFTGNEEMIANCSNRGRRHDEGHAPNEGAFRSEEVQPSISGIRNEQGVSWEYLNAVDPTDLAWTATCSSNGPYETTSGVEHRY